MPSSCLARARQLFWFCCFYDIITRMLDNIVKLPTHSNSAFLDLAKQYPFFTNLNHLSQLITPETKLLNTGTKAEPRFSLVNISSTIATDCFSFETRYKINSAQEKELISIFLHKNGPPAAKDPFSSRSNRTTLKVQSDGKICSLSVQESYWKELMDTVPFPINVLPQNEAEDLLLIGRVTSLSDIRNHAIIDYISRSSEIACQAFGVEITPRSVAK